MAGQGIDLTGAWIAHPGTQALCAALEGAGFRAFFVGGCVRNALMGIAVTDIDIATDAAPETVSDIAEAAGFKVVPTGIAHGTVTVITGSVPHEVTTFRRDVATDGRHATVAFSTRIEDDAARRDFTMNALYADRKGRVIDPLAGLPDLRARHVRFVGLPEARICEDYLRILRFFRFHALYGDPDTGIDPEGLAACAANTAGIDTLSAERIGAEMRKLLAAPHPAPSVAAMAAAGALLRVLPGADARALAPLVHLEGVENAPPRWLRRLAVLGGSVDRLRLSRQEARALEALRDGIGSGLSPAALGWMQGADLAADILLARAALTGAPSPPGWQAEVARGVASVFPVTAADLMPGLSGAALGARLKALEQEWLARDLRPGRDDLLG